MSVEPCINDLLDPKIKNFEDLNNHYDLVDRLQKSFYFIDFDNVDEITSNAMSLPLTEISVELFQKALEELNCSTNKASGNKKSNKFNLKFAARVTRKSFISPYCFILALIYIKRLKQINAAYVASMATCDLFLISLIISSKFLYEETTDEEILNIEWSTISGIDVKKLNQMEIDFLFKLNWNAYVGPLEFIDEWIKIENLVIKNECKKRSYQFITYNEIMRIFENDKVYQSLVSNFLTFMSKFILIALFAYSSVVVALVLLSRSSILQKSIANNSHLIDSNQTHWHNKNNNYYSESNDRLIDGEENESITDESIDESIEQLNTELSSKTLNLNKLNNLDLNELNNRLNILNGQEDGFVNLKVMSIDVYTIQVNDQKCIFNNNFDQIIKTIVLSNQRTSNHHNENHSDYQLFKLRKVFLQSRIY